MSSYMLRNENYITQTTLETTKLLLHMQLYYRVGSCFEYYEAFCNNCVVGETRKEKKKTKTNPNSWISEPNSTLHFHQSQASVALCFSKMPFIERQAGFCLQVAEALNEQETCHTRAALLCLSERINLCLSLPSPWNLPSPARSPSILSSDLKLLQIIWKIVPSSYYCQFCRELQGIILLSYLTCRSQDHSWKACFTIKCKNVNGVWGCHVICELLRQCESQFSD